MAKKNSAQLTLFQETVYEYFILLSPDDNIKVEVDRLKQLLHEAIGLDTANMNSVAHVSLFKQTATESMELPKTVKKALAGQKKFAVKLTGHEILKHGNVSRTLCLKIEDPAPINKLLTILDPKQAPKKVNRQTSILDKPKRPKKVIHPHITIARNIALADFERLTDLTDFDYHDEWMCDRVTILRRVAGSSGYYSPVMEVKLG
jgi:2'-5' RNA ligase